MEKGIAWDLLVHNGAVHQTTCSSRGALHLYEMEADVPYKVGTVIAILNALFSQWIDQPMDTLFCERWGDNPDGTMSTTAVCMATRVYILLVLVGKDRPPVGLNPDLQAELMGVWSAPHM